MEKLEEMSLVSKCLQLFLVAMQGRRMGEREREEIGNEFSLLIALF